MVRLLSVNPNSPYQPWARSHSRGGRGRLQPPPGGETRPACWRMKALRRDLVDPKITEHEGRIVDIRRGRKAGARRLSRESARRRVKPV